MSPNRHSCLIFFLIAFVLQVGAQSNQLTGSVRTNWGEPIVGASVFWEGTTFGVSTNVNGEFTLPIPEKVILPAKILVRHVQYESQSLIIEKDSFGEELLVVMKEKTTELQGVEVVNESENEEVVSVMKIDRKTAVNLPSAFGDFNKILVTLAGVSGNNELSSAYSVRGGSFDENLVYVNDIPVYRPFLSNAGRQEGLSFVNPNMVENIEFYAGGWEAKYGDKLSSSLNIEYKEPTETVGGITAGLLGGTVYYGSSHKRFSHISSLRHKDSRYLLNTLKTAGQYFPTYTDFQSLMTFDLSGKSSTYINKTKLNVLVSYGRNRYLTRPESQDTQFGSVQANFRLQTAFAGEEQLNYDTYQLGFRLTHRMTNRFRTHLIGSLMRTFEREYYDVEGYYRLCDINTNASDRFDECVLVRGVGGQFDHGRNQLKAFISTFENRNEFLAGKNNKIEFGIGVNFQQIRDELNEYSYKDSADYVIDFTSTFNQINMNAANFYAYIQNTKVWSDSTHAVSYGVRASYFTYNDQVLVSPRFSYRYSPHWKVPTFFKFSTGYYQQPPFYRELRDYNGNITANVRAQKSIHYILGVTRVLEMWGRPFLLNTDVYYKRLYDIIPYDIENLRIRYHSDKNASGYATGIDFRLNGEFVKGTQSWFSIGLLRTREDIVGDNYTLYYDEDGEVISQSDLGSTQIADSATFDIGSVRRPMDQRINMAISFEDHMPNDPTLRVNLNMVFGSGYPFGPPNNARFRNVFSGDEYYRVDIGMSKHIKRSKENRISNWIIRLELLNALGADNTISYYWIEDVYGNNFAIPNSLSARFLNIKISAEL